jgi:hypothetical protein
VTDFVKIAAIAAVFLTGNAAERIAAEQSPIIVEIETPLDSPHPLQGYMRQTTGISPSPAVVLLHSCSGDWRRLDERWGKRIASWGYVTLTVDSFGPRGLSNCSASRSSIPTGLRCWVLRSVAGWLSCRSSTALSSILRQINFALPSLSIRLAGGLRAI